MVWGQPPSANLTQKIALLNANSPTLTTLYLLSFATYPPSLLASLFLALKNNTHLRILYASGHSLDQECLSALKTGLEKNRGIKELCVGDDKFGAEGIKSVVDGLLSQIEYLENESSNQDVGIEKWDLENKGLDEHVGPWLRKLVAGYFPLKELVLSRNDIKDDGLKELVCGFLSENLGPVTTQIRSTIQPSRVTTLKLRRTGLTSAAFDILEPYLCSSDCSLQFLDVSENESINDDICGSLETVLSKNKSLQKLDLSETRISVSTFWTILNHIYSHPAVTDLLLNSCNISHDSSFSFSGSRMSDITTTRETALNISLRSNPLSNFGLNWLIPFVKWLNIKSLNLSDCRLDLNVGLVVNDLGIIGLRELGLAGNRFIDDDRLTENIGKDTEVADKNGENGIELERLDLVSCLISLTFRVYCDAMFVPITLIGWK
ncbi:hypothetical protein BKA69DRAFT_305872 [Paraphysoderma sedebokerense]|nr:hypothetical protein BKA69DRAFT_305872 [Paraphysoderma sedebokerense]